MQLNDLQHGSLSVNKKRVGRGGKKGKTCGRGTKGQKSRAGAKIRPQERDFIKKIPKLRGYSSHMPLRKPCVTVNVKDIEKVYSDGEHITPSVLLAKKMIAYKGKRMPKVKLLGIPGTKINKKFVVQHCAVSAQARKEIETAGGKIIPLMSKVKKAVIVAKSAKKNSTATKLKK